MNVSYSLLGALACSVAIIGVWYLHKWRRPWREIAVWPGDPLETGEGVCVRFSDGRELELAKKDDGSYRSHLDRGCLEEPFVVLRTPDLVPEVGFHGQDLPPRSAALIDEPLWIFPAAWSDRKPHDCRLTRVGRHEDFPVTKSKRVEKGRMVRVHLPKTYDEQKDRHYPIVYFLDGQNVFDASTAFGGVEWCLDEIIHQLEEEGEEPPILVGIDNGGMRREREYTFCSIDGKEEGGAEEHLRFILEEVDPFIRQKYRVVDGAASLVGSSLGGLFALWAAIAHPEAFHSLAAVSPSIWWAKGKVLQLPLQEGTRPHVWLCMGSNEGQGAEEAFDYACQRLHELGWRDGDDLRGLLVKNGHHHESAWADRSPTILRFLQRARK